MKPAYQNEETQIQLQYLSLGCLNSLRTDRQTNRQTDRHQTDRQTDRPTDQHTDIVTL